MILNKLINEGIFCSSGFIQWSANFSQFQLQRTFVEIIARLNYFAVCLHCWYR